MERVRSAIGKQRAASQSDGDLLRRYAGQREEAAFEALVCRHGPMVLGVCHRVLRDLHDAEDAFQATFLILVRKASTLRSPELVGNWLYGVAYRTALEARKATALRRAKEAQVVLRNGSSREAWAELRPELDQELDRLPEKYRAVLILCDLEGKTRAEAALDLRCPEGTVASRLATAREMLAKRLLRRGLFVSSGVLAAMLSRTAAAGVPPTVVGATIKAARLLAPGRVAASPISPEIAALMEGVLKTMLVSQLRQQTG